MKRIQVILGGLLLSVNMYACNAPDADAKGNKITSANASMAEESGAAPTNVVVVQKWDLPEILREVSGIAYLGDNRFACVQDEAGVIFIYNTQSGQIERQITFGAAGDYEGIALAGTTAYVVRSDGQIFEITNINTEQNKITDYATSLTAMSNVEGLAFDKKNNRLLLALKGEETAGPDFKGVYAFDLNTKRFAAQPVFKLNLHDPLLVSKGQKKKSKKNKGNSLSKNWEPSEIAIHPVTGDIYLAEATNPQLFILHADGSIKERHQLNSSMFLKPEGIAFGPAGELFISNEGKKQSGNILQVNLK